MKISVNWIVVKQWPFSTKDGLLCFAKNRKKVAQKIFF